MSTETPKKPSYKDTLNLPQTAFAMEAKLVQNEPPRLRKWQEMDLYAKLMEQRKDAPLWILHDGPPFANGDIHIGHLINKTLKDVIMRFRSMQGHRTPYVPGWDCHGLPIEHKIQEELQKKLGMEKFRELTPLEIRKACFDSADTFAKKQSEQFQRLGILGEWSDPYMTMAPKYEASTLEVFAKFIEAGLVYKKLKPVPWSISNQTALADAELEYKDREDPSVFVEFPALVDGLPADAAAAVPGAGSVSFLVWTTTPWTLPANLAIAVHPDVRYAFVRYTRNGKAKVGVVAEDLANAVFGRKGVESGETVAVLTGQELVDAHLQYKHPFIERTGRILPALYVTTTDGTGLVHTAPGHGEEDYNTGLSHGLPVYCPVQANGRFDDTAPEWVRGKTVFEANPVIVQHLKDSDHLFDEVTIVHSYPHDWRSKKPVILRATEQWFVGVDQPYSVQGQSGGPRSLRERAQHAASHDVQFIPEWGSARLQGMLNSRPDWCISRQRAWGLPIPVFYNEKGEALLTPESVRAVAKRFAEKGSDAWFTDSPAELLGSCDPGPNFPKDKLRKEQDIFDVWFESGSSWNAVLRGRPYLRYPSDMYLEGSDQHRGWFQLSLLPALGATGQPPFKQILTHGFAVKPDGTKVSKSDKEYVTATKEIDTHGADVLRLWCCSVDYQNDIPTSPQTIKEFGDKYRKIRNTLRYLLSNLYDCEPTETWRESAGAPVGAASAAAPSSSGTILGVPLNSLDGWALAQLDELIVEVTKAYDAYQLHRVFRLLHDFCAVQISAVYGNAMKDRLYTEAPASPLRRRTQFVMHKMVLALTKLLAPMTVFTADEAWEHVPHKSAEDAGLASVHLALLPKPSGTTISDDQREEWKLLMEVRDQALESLTKLIDMLRETEGEVVNGKKSIKYKGVDAELVIAVGDDAIRRKLQAYGVDLADLVGTGHHTFVEKAPGGPSISAKVVDRRDTYKACARSWKRRPDVGADPEYPELILRDAAALRALQDK